MTAAVDSVVLECSGDLLPLKYTMTGGEPTIHTSVPLGEHRVTRVTAANGPAGVSITVEFAPEPVKPAVTAPRWRWGWRR